MKIRRARILGDAHARADVYYTAEGRGRFNGRWYKTTGWGSTPNRARLNLLWSLERRRFQVDDQGNAIVWRRTR